MLQLLTFKKDKEHNAVKLERDIAFLEFFRSVLHFTRHREIQAKHQNTSDQYNLEGQTFKSREEKYLPKI